MVALVTGAAGFLGTAICERLAAADMEVVCAGRPECEIPSPTFDDLLQRAAPDLIVHCAGPASVGNSVVQPGEDFAGSAGVLASVLDKIRALSSVPRFLLLSSAAVYGEPESLPVSETHPLNPISPYGHHRVACEALLREFNDLFSIPVATMRIFSGYGEGLRRQILWDACSMGVETGHIELHGTGRESRDFIHARDIAEAAFKIAERGAFAGEAYNIGSGRETTIGDLAEMIRSGLGLAEGAVSFAGDARPGDPLNWRADISRLQALGFGLSVSIDEGVSAYVEWARRVIVASPVA